MRIELSKREIKVILEFMGAGKTFLITHQSIGYVDKKDKKDKNEKEKINIDDLEEKLRSKI